MIADDVADVLAELVRDTGAVAARIVAEEELAPEGSARLAALGDGDYLRVELPVRAASESDARPALDFEAAIERAVRLLRTIRRRWEAERLPALSHVRGHGGPPAASRVLDRIERYLRALADIDRAANAFVTRGPRLVASARSPSELESSRWPLLARRVLGVHAPGSSHGEVVDPDAYAMTFWYDATLVVLLDEPFALDFVRHRCRQVARELCNLLPLLDPGPPSNAAERL